MGDLNAFAVGWTDWNLFLNMEGGPNHLNNFCDACILGDPEAQIIYLQPSYYYMGQFSKFLPKGSIRVGLINSGNNTLEATAFLDPNENVVVIVMNQNDSPITFQIIDQGQYANYTIPEHAIVTLSYPKAVSFNTKDKNIINMLIIIVCLIL